MIVNRLPIPYSLSNNLINLIVVGGSLEAGDRARRVNRGKQLSLDGDEVENSGVWDRVTLVEGEG